VTGPLCKWLSTCDLRLVQGMRTASAPTGIRSPERTSMTIGDGWSGRNEDEEMKWKTKTSSSKTAIKFICTLNVKPFHSLTFIQKTSSGAITRWNPRKWSNLCAVIQRICATFQLHKGRRALNYRQHNFYYSRSLFMDVQHVRVAHIIHTVIEYLRLAVIT